MWVRCEQHCWTYCQITDGGIWFFDLWKRMWVWIYQCYCYSVRLSLQWNHWYYMVSITPVMNSIVLISFILDQLNAVRWKKNFFYVPVFFTLPLFSLGSWTTVTAALCNLYGGKTVNVKPMVSWCSHLGLLPVWLLGGSDHTSTQWYLYKRK